jgi:type IV pilus biogenesis protein CpaD/CtpE
LEEFQEGITACVNNTDYKKSPLATEFTGAGDQSCTTKNTDYCNNLIHNNNAKGYYTYDKSKDDKNCVVKVSASSTTVSDALTKAVTGFIQQCQNTMKGTSSVLKPTAYNNESTITCTSMTASEKDIKNVCKGNSVYDTKTKICTWTKK